MKTNAQKILLWLYPPSVGKIRWVSVTDLKTLVPALTESGQRSLLLYLQRKRSLELNGDRARITDLGMTLLRAEFDIFSRVEDWNRSWSIICFLKAPASDPSFRYLRKLLLASGAGQLTRAVYLYPGKLKAKVGDTLLTLYQENVLVLESDKWLFGDERIVANQLFALKDQQSALSGISREVDQLLSLKKRGKISIGQLKIKIFTVFDRLLPILGNDLGIAEYYYDDGLSSLSLLSLLKELLD